VSSAAAASGKALSAKAQGKCKAAPSQQPPAVDFDGHEFETTRGIAGADSDADASSPLK
jgi:hypothetical protein